MTRPWRALAAGDVPAALRLVNAEGWAFTADDFHRILHLGGGVVVEDAGRVTGVLTLVVHADQAWIGNVVVAPEARGRGVGRVLVDGALERAREAGVTRVGLYSVLPAVTLYERAGFRRGGRVSSLVGHATGEGDLPKGVRPFVDADLPRVRALDARAAGADRARLLRVLIDAFPEHAFVSTDARGDVDGFVIGKPGAAGSEIGPLVTRDPEAGDVTAALADAALATMPPGSVEAGVHDANPAAVRAFRDRGFKEAFPALAMHHGAGGEGDARLVGAVAGMEKG